MEQRIRDIQQNLAHNAMSGEFENLQPLVDEATVSLLQLIREAQIEELERLVQSGHAHFTAPVYIENRITELKAKESE